MNAPRHIVVGHDMSKRADRALRRALGLVQPDGRVSVLAAIEEATREVDFRTALEARLRSINGWDGFENKTIIVRVGEAFLVMANEAAALSADLVVIGMHRKRGLVDLVSAGTAARIVSRLPMPTLIAAHAMRGPYQRVLVAIDFEKSASAALSTAAEWFPRATLEIVHALDFRPGPRSGGVRISSELDDSRRQWMTDFIGKTLPFADATRVLSAPRLSSTRCRSCATGTTTTRYQRPTVTDRF